MRSESLRSLLALALALGGCGKGGTVTAVQVTADKTGLLPGESATLQATVIGSGSFSNGVTWSVDGGGSELSVMGASARYAAPLVGTTAAAIIRATSVDDASKYGVVAISLSLELPLLVTVSTPGILFAGQTETLVATYTAGVDGVQWAIEDGGPGTLSATAGASVDYMAPPYVSAMNRVTVRASASNDPATYGLGYIYLQPITVTLVSSPPPYLQAGQTLTLQASVSGPAGTDLGVVWSIQSGGGTLAAMSGTSVQFTAPAVSSQQRVVVRATSVADPTQYAEQTLTVQHGWPVVVQSGDGRDVARGVTFSGFGLYVAGETEGHFDIPQQGQGDGFVASFDNFGNLAWVRQFGTVQADHVTGVVANFDTVYVAGYTLGRFPGSSSTCGGSIGFLIAYDSSGNFKWRKELGCLASGSSVATDCGVFGITLDGKANVYAAGSCAFPLGFVQQCTTTGCDGPGTLLTLVAASAELPLPFFRAIGVIATGDYDLVGWTGGGVLGNDAGAPEVGFVTQVQPSNPNPPAWVQSVAPTNPVHALQLVTAQALDTDIYVGGMTNGALAGQTSLGGWDGVLGDYDLRGNPVWLVQFGTSSDDEVSGVAASSTIGLFATGTIDAGAGAEEVLFSIVSGSNGSMLPLLAYEDAATADEAGGVAVGIETLAFAYTSIPLGGPTSFSHVVVRCLDNQGNSVPLGCF